MTAHCDTPTLFDVLKSELDKRLATLPSDQARYRCLILQGNIWQTKFAEYLATDKQPFGGPHPDCGKMDSFDFRLLLCEIDRRKTDLERAVLA